MKISDVKTTDILPRHDLVFKAPVCDPTYGIPLGDGSNGYLLWFEENKLNININSTDLIDDIGAGDFYTKREDETHAVCRNGAKLSVDFGCPIFDSIYQSGFEARLSLKNATATIENQTPFSSNKITAFASEKSKVAIVSVNTEGTDEMSLRSALERWGSRTFMYWYIRFSPNNSAGLSGTKSGIFGKTFYVSQELNGMCFTVAVMPLSDCAVNTKKRNKHSAECETECRKEINIDYYITLATGKTTEETEKEAYNNLKNAVKQGKEEIYKEHLAMWEEFWNKSFISLPEDMDFAENLWYLNLYYGNCQMRGKYPPHFCNGVWGFYHDFVPWNMYFHYNTQHSINSYGGANHPELCKTYFNFRNNQLPKAKIYAREIKNTKGAFFTDISDLKGRMIANNAELSKNCTCGAQIAMLMYKNYLYTGDINFYENTAMPFMKEIGKFYLDMLYIGSDGKYHITDTTAYEGSPLFADSITDLSAIRALFNVLVNILPTNEAEVYIDRLNNLVDFTYVDMENDEVKDGKFVHGLGKGNTVKGTKVLSVGIPIEKGQLEEGKPARKTFGTAEKQQNSYYGFPDAEMSVIYPAGIVGIKDKGTKLYNAVYNSICIHHPALLKEDDNKDGMCMGWCMMPIYLARMGMAKELYEQIKRSISTWIAYPQGFGLYGGYDSPGGKGANTKRGTKDRFIKMDILKIDGEHKEKVIEFNNDFFDDKPEYHSTVNLWNFRHFDLEALPIISNALTEMLVQSYDECVRLFCSITKDSEVSFKLATEGGFTVSASYKSGECNALFENNLGNELKTAFENINSEVSFYNYITGERLEFEEQNKVYTLKTPKGTKILAVTDNGKDICINPNMNVNQNAKHMGDAMLGCDREF